MLDVAIIGGSFAGLTAAQLLGRASRTVRVIDAGQPRNRTSPAAHGVAGWDGTPPSEILARFRADLETYATVELARGTVTGVSGGIDGFELICEDGSLTRARRVILAHGVRDTLPGIPGLREAWGRRVLHCPYCHGYEVKGERLAVLAVHPMSGHQARLLRSGWSDDVTLIAGGAEVPEAETLRDEGISIEPRTLSQIAADDTGVTLTFQDGATDRIGAVFLGSMNDLSGSPARALGCATTEGPMGLFVATGPMSQTSVPGVFAAGDLSRPAPNINFALADGAQAGTGCHASLVFPDFIQPIEVSQ